jgi:hypothetical protein
MCTYLISHLIDENAHEVRISLFPVTQELVLGRSHVTYYPLNICILKEKFTGIINAYLYLFNVRDILKVGYTKDTVTEFTTRDATACTHTDIVTIFSYVITIPDQVPVSVETSWSSSYN